VFFQTTATDDWKSDSRNWCRINNFVDRYHCIAQRHVEWRDEQEWGDRPNANCEQNVPEIVRFVEVLRWARPSLNKKSLDGNGCEFAGPGQIERLAQFAMATLTLDWLFHNGNFATEKED
jgi:hypothetical protein